MVGSVEVSGYRSICLMLIADVERMYGQADSTDAGSYNYGDIRFETNDGRVVKVVIDCNKQE